MSPEIFKFFAEYIKKEIGIIYSETNSYQLEGRLLDIVKYAGLTSIEELHQKAIVGLRSDLKQLLLDIATNNETSFFRDKHVFDNLENNIIPALVKEQDGTLNLKIWSAASSYGQEALSIAMIINELKGQGKKISARILASDISEKVLTRAKSGCYTQLEIQRGLPIKLLTKYFEQAGEGWKARPEIMSYISFYQQNLLMPFQFNGPFDMIFCRNVLIYQNIENKKAIINKIHMALKDGGYLFLGAGESLMGISGDFSTCNINNMICYRKKVKVETAA